MTNNIYLKFSTGEQILIPAGESTAGRQDDNPIVVAGQGISRQHAKFKLQGNQLWIIDLGSANGTYVNRKRLAPNQPELLHEGDMVTFGRQTNFTVHGFATGGYQATVIEDEPLLRPSTPQPGYAPAETPCPNCGVMNPINAKFCGGCGSDVNPPGVVAGLVAKLKANPVLLAAIVLPIILLIGGLIVGSFYFTSSSNTVLPLPAIFSDNRGLSSWIPATTIDDKELHVLYVVNPLTGEKHRLVEGEKNTEEIGFILFVSQEYIVRYNSMGMSNFYGVLGHGGIVAYPLPNDKQVVYMFKQDDLWQLAITDMDGKNSSTLIRDATRIFPVIDSDDNIIVVTVTDEDKMASAYLFSLSDGKQLATLFQDADKGTALPLPYSNKIFFSTLIDDERTHYVANTDGSEPVETYQAEVDEEDKNENTDVDFLPNGEQYIYAPSKGLYLINFDGSGKQELRRGQVTINDISADGSHLLIHQSYEDNTKNLYMISIADGNLIDLARGVDSASGLFVNDKILYQEKGKNETDLILYTIENGETMKLVRGAAYLRDFCSDSLRYCAYAHQRDSGSQRKLDIVDTYDGQIIDVPQGRDDFINIRDMTDSQIVFSTSEIGEQAILYSYNFLDDKSEPVILDDQAESYEDALILGGGTKIMFSASFGDNNGAVYIIDADGSNRKLLLDDATMLGR
jgi:hypothetical protein